MTGRMDLAPVDLAPAVRRLLALGRDGTHPAGSVVGVLTGGTATVAAGGYAVLPQGGRVGVPMRESTVLDLASVTKVASTTALALVLVGRGELDLDAPVVSVLPWFSGGGRDQVLVRHLLAHTSGLPPWVPLYLVTSGRAESIAAAGAQDLVDPPGTRWCYSDLGMVLMGAVVERVVGLRQDEAFRQLVADPLNLVRTGYRPPPAEALAASSDGDLVEHDMVRTREPYPVDATVDQFDGWRDHATIGEVADGNAAHALDGVSGHAGLFAPAAELLRLARALVDGTLAPVPVVRLFTTPDGVAPDHGLGVRLATWRIGDDDVPVAWHGGFTGTWLATALDRDLAVFAAGTRLHGVVGTLAHRGAPRADWVTGDEIAATARDEVGRALVDARAMPPAHPRTTTRGGLR